MHHSMKAAIGLLLASALHQASAQTTSASCQSGFEWMANSLQQSPCLVAAYLGHQCTPSNSFNVPPLVSDQQYLPPSQQQANDCQCSSVYYSLLSGCAACQGSSLSSFTTWTKACASNAITIQSYPLTAPNDTRIPSWAYLPFKDGALDIGAARRNATGQDSYGEPQHFSVGVIIGLVLGSVAVLTLVGAAIWMYCRLQSAKARGFDALHSIEASRGSNKSSPSQNSANNEPPSYSNMQERQQRQSTEQDNNNHHHNRNQIKPLVRYDKIEGPPRPERKFFFFPKRPTTVVKSYRPGLNFDLDKGRRGDLLELSENNGSKRSFSRFSSSAIHLTSPTPTSSGSSSTLLQSATSLDSPSHPAKLSKKQKPYQEHYEHYPLPLQLRREQQNEVIAESITSTPSLSQMFSRPKEVKPQKGDVRVDLAAETEDDVFPRRHSESNPRPRSEINDSSPRFGPSRIR
ncbi:hypothetical protein FRC18_010911 [Serendipita sp. 400]|nr:hypothetical protein FRC18_010911 [Serendipita sp. 400]